MNEEIEFDKNLWFYHNGCEGKHYLIGNPHTFYGRMWAWCPKKQKSFFVSLVEIGEKSEQAKYWIDGFLCGNQPAPPTDVNDDVDFESPAYKKWIEAIKLFSKTGYWTDMERQCDKCGKELLNSEIEDICQDCRTDK